MKKISMTTDVYHKTLFRHPPGQSLVEFALILPMFVLFLIGVFELGRAFFSYIAISNAAREGTRMVTFWHGKETVVNIQNAVYDEIGSSPMVDISNIDSIVIECGIDYQDVPSERALADCPSDEPVRVSVVYEFRPIVGFLLPDPILLRRATEMMVP